MRQIYTALYYFAIPFILIRLLWRSRHTAGYRKRWSERIGLIKPIPKEKSIWIHAVSVGETIAAIPLIKAIIEKFTDYTIVVSSTTPTGSALVKKQFGKTVHHVYSPFDTPTSVGRFLKRARPALCIIMETELWPNLLLCCKKNNTPIILANGRLSERSSLRYQLIESLTRQMLAATHMIIAQGVLDGERYLRLGLNPKKLVVSGNIKFDMHIPETEIQKGKAIKSNIGNKTVFIAASTHETEEATVLNAFKKIRTKIPDAFLILVPRHVDRFQKVYELCVSQNWQTVRRSEGTTITSDTNILLVDTIGELRMIYAAADIAFVGGSLTPVGGHNLIEPAALGLPILTGPNLQNFTQISKLLQNAGAAQIITDANSLAEAVIGLCEAQELREKIGLCAIKTIEANRGALEKHLTHISACLQKNTSH